VKITFLGTGPSPGVPAPCCDCEVCRSDDPGNKRLRASILAQNDGYNILVDTATDLRQQSLIHKINRIDAILYTHHHADHILGLEELRCFNYFNAMTIPCYGREETFARIRQTFHYVFDADNSYNGWVSKVELHPVDSKTFTLGGVSITPVEVMHGDMTILSYKFNDASAYVTDCSAIPDAGKEKLRGLDLLILNALRHDPHPNHLTLAAALDLVEELRPKRTLLTHMNHQIDYRRASKNLPEGVKLAYDGLCVEV
jgi:phosphoribosyl 1,2-cyclic phosphate phosphodiesterase